MSMVVYKDLQIQISNFLPFEDSLLKAPIPLTQGPWPEPKIFQKSSIETSLDSETALKYEQNGGFFRCLWAKPPEKNESSVSV